jgi:DNA-binding SARP family transcriptional activator
MLALYRSRRQAEALEAYREARRTLDELGIEPSANLQRLERAILLHDEELVIEGLERRVRELPAGTVLRVRLDSPLTIQR